MAHTPKDFAPGGQIQDNPGDWGHGAGDQRIVKTPISHLSPAEEQNRQAEAAAAATARQVHAHDAEYDAQREAASNARYDAERAARAQCEGPIEKLRYAMARSEADVSRVDASVEKCVAKKTGGRSPQ